MPRFFFDTYDGTEILDDTGTEFLDLEAMRGGAIQLAGEILKDANGKLVGNVWGMTVRDEAGQRLMTVCFSAVLH